MGKFIIDLFTKIGIVVGKANTKFGNLSEAFGKVTKKMPNTEPILKGLGALIEMAGEDETSILQLRAAMNSFGLSYDENRDKIEAWVNAMQHATAVSDTEIRTSLADLILKTGDYAAAQDLLKVAMDVSAGTGEDLGSVIDGIGEALGGNWEMLEGFVPALQEIEGEEQKWQAVRQAFMGQSEEYGKSIGGQMKLLCDTVRDLKESIGKTLAPVLEKLNLVLIPLIERIQKWIDEHPGLVRAILIAIGVLAGLVFIIGLFMSFVMGAAGVISILMAAFSFLCTPVGLITLLIAELIALTALVILYWEELKAAAIAIWESISEFFQGVWERIKATFTETWNNIKETVTEIWNNIKEKATEVWDGIVEYFTTKLSNFVDKFKEFFTGIKDFFEETWNNIKSFFTEIWNGIVGHFEEKVNNIIDGLNKLIARLNELPRVNIKLLEKVDWTSDITSYARGGIVSGQIGQAQLAIVHGGETIIPVGGSVQGQGITNNFKIERLVVREEADIHKVARELLHLQKTRSLQYGI